MHLKKQKLNVWTDGSSHAKGGLPIGWAYVICLDNYPIDVNYGGSEAGTNNEAELTAAINGLKALEARIDKHPVLKHCEITLVSDSQYVLGLASGAYNPSKNVELAKELREITIRLGARTRWVAGHSGVVWNERCDSLAKRGKEEAKYRLAKNRGELP